MNSRRHCRQLRWFRQIKKKIRFTAFGRSASLFVASHLGAFAVSVRQGAVLFEGSV